MSSPVLPAPFWRRLASALYDGLLLLGVWMSALWLDVLVRDLLDLERSWPALRACLFLVGFAFCGWFWTHGGQTLGMRAWRLQVRCADGAAPSWSRAVLRYAVAWLAWMPLGAGVLWSLLDSRRRAWHDIASDTELVLLPKTG
ncbi:MAG: RDD family protein [Gammaproteobacteria bacterium]|nr:RDD family protein [Gammaproteobacteria bacterium]